MVEGKREEKWKMKEKEKFEMYEMRWKIERKKTRKMMNEINEEKIEKYWIK